MTFNSRKLQFQLPLIPHITKYSGLTVDNHCWSEFSIMQRTPGKENTFNIIAQSPALIMLLFSATSI